MSGSLKMKTLLFLLLTVIAVCFFTYLGSEPFQLEDTWGRFRDALLYGDENQAAQLLDSQAVEQHYLSGWRTIFQGSAAGVWSVSKLIQPKVYLWPTTERQVEFILTLADGSVLRYPVLFRRSGQNWRIGALPELYASPAALLYRQGEQMVLLIEEVRFEAVELPAENLPMLGLALCEDQRVLYWQPAGDLQYEAQVVSFAEGTLRGSEQAYPLAEQIALYHQKDEDYRVLSNFSPGMTQLRFCVWQERIVGGLLDSSWQPERIRVLLHGADTGEHYHRQVTLLNARDATYQIGDGAWTGVQSASLHLAYEENQIIIRDANRRELYRGAEQVIRLSTAGDVLQLYFPEGISRGVRGIIEVRPAESGFLLLNDLPLEQYLRGVVGNEMPADFGSDALQLQAIAARGYALQAILTPSGWQRYGAHLDDSTASQVYLLNSGENSAVDIAVAATEDEVLFYQDQPLRAYFFSTSGGFTAAAAEVWLREPQQPGQRQPYLEAQAQGYGLPLQRSEQAILEFYQRSDWQVPDRYSPWFRWQLSLSGEELSALLGQNISLIAEEYGGYLQQKNPDGSFTPLQQPVTEDWLGAITELRATWRGANGQLLCLEIVGEGNTCRLSSEWLIRKLWQPTPEVRPIYVVSEGNERVLELLPSAFVAWTKSSNGGFTFYGGGYGHGVGMSQYGARGLLQAGWSKERVLRHYYPGTILQSWRDWY